MIRSMKSMLVLLLLAAAGPAAAIRDTGSVRATPSAPEPGTPFGGGLYAIVNGQIVQVTVTISGGLAIPVTYSPTGQAIGVANTNWAMPVAPVRQSYGRIIWSQSWVGAQWFHTEGICGMNKWVLSVKEMLGLQGGTYSFTIDGAVDPALTPVNVATITQASDATNVNVVSANLNTPWPLVRFNLTACSKCSTTNWLSATLWLAEN